VHWAFLSSAALGFVMGVCLRAPALIAASAGAAALNIALGALSGWPLSCMLVSTIGLIAALQLGYLVGAFLAAARSGGARRNG
jgi:hypothetical protein